MRWLEAACLVVVTAALVYLLMGVRRLVADVDQQVVPTAQHLNAVVDNANQAIDIAKVTEGKWAADGDKEAKYLDMTSLQTYKLITDTKYAVGRLDHSVNEVLVPQLVTDLSDSDGLIKVATGSVQKATDELSPSLANLAQASAAIAQQAANPQIGESVAHLDVVTDQLAGVATDAHTETSLIVGQTRKAFAPKNKFMAILQLLGGGAVQAASGYYYFTH